MAFVKNMIAKHTLVQWVSNSTTWHRDPLDCLLNACCRAPTVRVSESGSLGGAGTCTPVNFPAAAGTALARTSVSEKTGKVRQ